MEGITTPALFLTAKAEIEDRVTGLDAGADDYLPKPFDASEFLARVRALTRRSSAYTPSRLTLGNTALDCGTYQLRTPYGETRLNNKEYQLMELFLRNPQQVFSSEHLIERIWGLDSESEMEVIWTYIGFLRKKLRQIGADIEIKTIRSLLFITLAVAGGSLLLVFALVVRQPRTQHPADRHLHERGRVGDGKRRKRMGAEHPIAIRAAVKAHFQPCHALPSGRGKPVPGAHGVFPQRCGMGDRGAVFVSDRGKGQGIHAVHCGRHHDYGRPHGDWPAGVDFAG